jgi:hypothetical protein
MLNYDACAGESVGYLYASEQAVRTNHVRPDCGEAPAGRSYQCPTAVRVTCGGAGLEMERMRDAMIRELKLTGVEMELLLEVLEARQRDLANEIGHTEALRAKAELRKRGRAIDRLVERVRAELTPQPQQA